MRYQPGDYIKVELEGEGEQPGEWVWVLVQSADDHLGMVFGLLDNQPISAQTQLRIGQSLAISYEKVRDHRKSRDFPRNH